MKIGKDGFGAHHVDYDSPISYMTPYDQSIKKGNK